MTSNESNQPGTGQGASLRGVDRLIAHVRGLPAVRMAVVHPCDALSLGGAMDARDAGVIVPVLVAPEEKLRRVAADAGIDLAGCEIVDAPHSHGAAATAARLAGKGEVQAIMKGSLHSDELLGAILAPDAGLRTERRLTHCFIMETASYPRPFIITDAAINIAPTLAEKRDITQNAIDLAHALRIPDVRVAILSAMETVNPAVPSTVEAAALCKMADRGQITGAHLDGPLALDNAIDLEAARIKGIHSAVAGQANILVVPDLEAGNMLAKSLSFLAHARSAGIVLGAKVPIILTSRADTHIARLASCAVASMLAQARRDNLIKAIG